MRVRILACLFFGVISSGSASAAQTSCKALGDNLYNCTKFECTTPDPSNPKQFITNVVKGYDKNGECVHEQSSPSGEKLVCSYSDESRKFLGLKMKKSGSDIAGIENVTEFEENLMADIFQNECEVVSKTGVKKSPAEAAEDGDSESFGDNQGDAEEATPENGDEATAPEPGEPESLPAKGVENNGDLLDSK